MAEPILDASRVVSGIGQGVADAAAASPPLWDVQVLE
jgi:hypothetical protein